MQSMKGVRRGLVACVAVVAWECAMPAYAQLAVVDPVNLIQNLLTASRALMQVENQIKQLENEAQMLVNEAKNLKRLDVNELNRIRVAVATTRRLFDEARGLSLTISELEQQYRELYPENADRSTSLAGLRDDARRRWVNSREALATALEVQAQANANFADDETVLAELVSASQGAEGALQANQATNQLLALQTRELIQAQQVAIAQDRAASMEHARAVAAEERARETRRRFMQGDSAYTAEPVRVFRD